VRNRCLSFRATNGGGQPLERSWFMELLGSTYPEAGRETAPYL